MRELVGVSDRGCNLGGMWKARQLLMQKLQRTILPGRLFEPRFLVLFWGCPVGKGITMICDGEYGSYVA